MKEHQDAIGYVLSLLQEKEEMEKIHALKEHVDTLKKN